MYEIYITNKDTNGNKKDEKVYTVKRAVEAVFFMKYLKEAYGIEEFNGEKGAWYKEA